MTADLHSGLKLLLELNLTTCPAAISVFPFTRRFKHGLLEPAFIFNFMFMILFQDRYAQNKQTNKELGVNEVCFSGYVAIFVLI